MRRTYILLIFLFIFPAVFSQGLFESSLSGDSEETTKTSDIFSGYVRGSAFGFGKKYDYANIFSELSLKTNITESNLIIKSDLRFRGGIMFDEDFTRMEIKEAYAGYTSDKVDFYLGNQIVMWGRTDGFNPTNNINPSDFFFLTADNDDQIKSNFMLRLRYRINSQIDIDLIGIPLYMPSDYRYDLFDIGAGISVDEPDLPGKNSDNLSFATRLNFEYPKIGFSLSYFSGYNTFYGIDIAGFTLDGLTPLITCVGKPYYKQSPGLDFAIPVSSWIIRGEMAYNHTENYKKNIHIPNPDLSYVLGIDRSFFKIQTILQYIGLYTFNFERLLEPDMPLLLNPIDLLSYEEFMKYLDYIEDMVVYEMTGFNRKAFYQQKETNHAIALTLARSFAYEIIDAELTAYYNITSEERLIRAKISWKASDNLSISAGGFFMDGPENSVFDYSKKILNGVFMELRGSF